MSGTVSVDASPSPFQTASPDSTAVGATTQPTSANQAAEALAVDATSSTPSVDVDTAIINCDSLNLTTTERARPERDPNWKCRATQLYPRYDLLLPGEPVGLDIEFQNFRVGGPQAKGQHRVGIVALVNTAGETILHVYAFYRKEEGVQKFYPLQCFKVNWQDFFLDVGAKPAESVERWVANIVQGRTVVVHGGQHDLTAFYIIKDIFQQEGTKVVDTQQLYSYTQHRGQPSLATAAAAILPDHHPIQQYEHDAVEDADTALKLYLKRFPYDRQAELQKLPRHINIGRGFGDNNNNQKKGRRNDDSSYHGASDRGDKTMSSAPLKLDMTDTNDFPALGAKGPAKKRR